jgi:hypothetical protein
MSKVESPWKVLYQESQMPFRQQDNTIHHLLIQKNHLLVCQITMIISRPPLMEQIDFFN